MIKNIFFTIDYELYFGENYCSEYETLFQPTKILIDELNQIDIPIVIFVDILSILAYEKEFGTECEYILLMKEQLQYAYKKGNEIALHIHPHWLKSTYDFKLKKWDFDMNYYNLSQFLNEFGISKIDEIIFSGIKYLKTLIDCEDYECTSFRAGGYSVLGCEEELISLLNKYNIKCDSSVYPHLELKSKYLYVNYLNTPEKNFWNISTSFTKDSPDGNILELPILSLKKNKISFLNKVINQLLLKLSKKKKYIKKGSSIPFEKSSKSEYAITFDYFNINSSYIMNQILQKYVEQYKKQEVINIVFNSHPKAMFKDSIKDITIYLKQLKEKGFIFKTIQSILKKEKK